MSSSGPFTVGDFLDEEGGMPAERKTSLVDALPTEMISEVLSFASIHEVTPVTSSLQTIRDKRTKSLKLDYAITATMADQLAERYPNVEKLILPQDRRGMENVLVILHRFHRLQSLYIYNIGELGMLQLKSCRRLKHLKIKDLEYADARVPVMQCMPECPDLEILSVRFDHMIHRRIQTAQLPEELPPKLRVVHLKGLSISPPDARRLMQLDNLKSLWIGKWSNEAVQEFARCCEEGMCNLSELFATAPQIKQMGILPTVRSLGVVHRLDTEDLPDIVVRFPNVEVFQDSSSHNSWVDVSPDKSDHPVHADVVRPWLSDLRHFNGQVANFIGRNRLKIFEQAPKLEFLNLHFEQPTGSDSEEEEFQCPPRLKTLKLTFWSTFGPSWTRIRIVGTPALQKLSLSLPRRTELILDDVPTNVRPKVYRH